MAEQVEPAGARDEVWAKARDGARALLEGTERFRVPGASPDVELSALDFGGEGPLILMHHPNGFCGATLAAAAGSLPRDRARRPRTRRFDAGSGRGPTQSLLVGDPRRGSLIGDRSDPRSGRSRPRRARRRPFHRRRFVASRRGTSGRPGRPDPPLRPRDPAAAFRRSAGSGPPCGDRRGFAQASRPLARLRRGLRASRVSRFVQGVSARVTRALHPRGTPRNSGRSGHPEMRSHRRSGHLRRRRHRRNARHRAAGFGACGVRSCPAR